MRFIIVRHVETKANAEKKYIGLTRSEHTSRGKEQIRKLLDTLKDEDVDMIYSSPLPRALDVAKTIGKELNEEVKIEPALIEMNFGIFENKTFIQAEEEFKEEWDGWVKDNINYKIPYGESLMEVNKRVTSFIDTIKDMDKTCILVTHGGIIHTIITYLLDLDINDRWHFKISTGAIVEIEYEDGYGVLVKLKI